MAAHVWNANQRCMNCGIASEDAVFGCQPGEPTMDERERYRQRAEAAENALSEAGRALAKADERRERLEETLRATMGPLINAADVLAILVSGGLLGPEATLECAKWDLACRNAHASVMATLGAASNAVLPGAAERPRTDVVAEIVAWLREAANATERSGWLTIGMPEYPNKTLIRGARATADAIEKRWGSGAAMTVMQRAEARLGDPRMHRRMGDFGVEVVPVEDAKRVSVAGERALTHAKAKVDALEVVRNEALILSCTPAVESNWEQFVQQRRVLRKAIQASWALEDRDTESEARGAVYGKRRCSACGKMTRVTTAGCDHCDLEDK